VKGIGSRYWDEVMPGVAARPQTLWRKHCDAVHASLLARGLGDAVARAALKTDLFDEATGDGLADVLMAKSGFLVGMDVSGRVLQAAAGRHPRLTVVAADARRLPFAAGTFDLVFSNSTLDHFESQDEIFSSLGEISRVLRPGGRLILTMDNPANPAVALRNALPSGLLVRLGVIPYRTGVTCSAARLAQYLGSTGLEVSSTTYIMHCPRIIAVTAARWLEGRRTGRAARQFLRWLGACEKLEGLPTRSWTGYFTAIIAVKPGPRARFGGDADDARH